MRAAVEDRLGSPIVSAVSQSAGFSPGVAARLRTEDGHRFFAKAAGPSPNPLTPAAHRREAKVAALPERAPVPRLYLSHDEGEGGWIVLVFEDVEGRNPAVPWRSSELNQILDTLASLSELLTPSPLPPGLVGVVSDWEVICGWHWRKLAEERPASINAWSARHLDTLAGLEAKAPASATGSTLLHLDLRADNLLLTPEDRVLVVDWPHARVGASWVDAVFFAPSMAMQGGPWPEALVAQHPGGRLAACSYRRGRRGSRVLHQGGSATRAAGVAHTAAIPGVTGRGGQGLAGTQDRIAVGAVRAGRRRMSPCAGRRVGPGLLVVLPTIILTGNIGLIVTKGDDPYAYR